MIIGTMRILVIDDSKLARFLARVTFEDRGYEVLEADGGEAGLRLARENMPDCVFLDLLMPGMLGREVLAEMRGILPDIPVIVLTADVQETTHRECLELGARAVVNKPRSGEELLDALRLVFPDLPPS